MSLQGGKQNKNREHLEIQKQFLHKVEQNIEKLAFSLISLDKKNI